MAIYYRRSRIILISLPFLVISCGEPKKEVPENLTIKEASGKEIYEGKCITCHGGNGDLGISGAADLSSSKSTLEEKIYTITFGGKNQTMIPYKGLLNEKEIESVAQYIETLKK